MTTSGTSPHRAPPSVLAQTCSELTGLVQTLCFLLEQARNTGADDPGDAEALRGLDLELQELRDEIATVLSVGNDRTDDDEADALRLRGGPPAPQSAAPAGDLLVRDAASDAYEIIESWRLTGRDDGRLRSALFDDVSRPDDGATGDVDEPEPEPRRPETAADLLELLLDAKGHSHSMHGTTESMPLATVLQFLSKAQRTGRLEVRLADETLTFALVVGELGFTATDRPRHGSRLGEQLVATGALTQDQLDAFLAEHDPAREPLAAALEAQKLVTRTQIRVALGAQARQRILRALDASVGAYAFYPGPGPDDDRMRMTVLELLLESCRQQDERSWRSSRNDG